VLRRRGTPVMDGRAFGNPSRAGLHVREEKGVFSAIPDESRELGSAPGVIRARGVVWGPPGAGPVLDGLDLEVGVGEIVALVGLTGAGKSTLLKLLAGELRQSSGTLDLPPRRTAAGRLMLGYAPPEDAHFESLTGRQNAMVFAQAAGLRRAEARSAVDEHISTLGLGERSDIKVARYGFEDRRRLLLVQALAHRPALALLDEPFLGLAQPTREALIRLLRVQAARHGTVIVASSELLLLPELVDRILFIHHGRIVRGGRVAELLASMGPATRIEVELRRRPVGSEVRFRPGITVIEDGDVMVLEATRGQSMVGDACSALIGAGAVIQSVKVREKDLAEAFRRATGAELQK